ncbi:MAG TPA: sulfatase [Planctomycetota bacterium]|nr:sulfatase [Planctomycetota bacterium]
MRTLALSIPLLLASSAAAQRPNIVFVFSDDHALQSIGAYARDERLGWGNWLADVDVTPRIDALAGQGMRFRRSFCTNSICGPSRAVIQTGLHSHRNGFRHNGDTFDGDQRTFPKLLQAAGYRTAVIGKWHLGSEPQGFDHWDVLPGQGDYYNPVLITSEGRRQVEGHVTDVVTDLALAWLEGERARDDDAPFLLMLQHKAPHRTWMPALRHLELWAEERLPEPPTLFDTYAGRAPGAARTEMTLRDHMDLYYDLFVMPRAGETADGARSLDASGRANLERMTAAQREAWDAHWEPRNEAFRAAQLEGDELVRWKHQRYLANYLRCVRGVDESVGRVVDWLEANDLSENTIVVYSSDQGFYLGDHGWYDKRWMYEESLSMPLIVRWPGHTQPGAVDDHLVQNLDYAPTFLEMAGVEVPHDMQGRSLVPLLEGRAPDDWREAIYFHYYEYPAVHMVPPHNGVRFGDLKLVHYYAFDEWELFDLEADPDELQNRYDDPDYAEIATELKGALEDARRHYGDDTVTGVVPEWVEAYR